MPAKEEKHFKDWPNAIAFNALDNTRDPIQLQVTGIFAPYSAGSLYRTGPGGYKIPRSDPKDGDMACSHWFDGFTTLHKFRIAIKSDGAPEVWYSSCGQVDELIESARKTGRLEGVTFGQKRDPCDTLYKKFKTVFKPIVPSTPRNVNAGVTFQASLPVELDLAERHTKGAKKRQLMTLTSDYHSTKTFDMDTLEPVGVAKQADLHPSLQGQLSAAHAAYDPETGDVYNYNLALGQKAVYRIFRANPKTTKVDILAEISGKDIQGAYIHSLFISPNFVILCIWPAIYSKMGLSILWERNLLDAISPFDPSAKATWLVVDRKGDRGLVKKFTSPAFFSFHSVNAWEVPSADEGSVDIICELCEFKDLSILFNFYYENMVSNGAGVAAFDQNHRANCAVSLNRYKLASVPLKGTATAQPAQAVRILSIHSPNVGDLPRINPRYVMKPHRYVWTLLDRGKSSFMDGVGKTDTETGTCLVWEKERHTPGEPVFVPKPGAEAEDEGVVLVVVLDGDKVTSYLLCLDARTMEEVGRAEVGKPVGMGFHGLHVPAASS